MFLFPHMMDMRQGWVLLLLGILICISAERPSDSEDSHTIGLESRSHGRGESRGHLEGSECAQSGADVKPASAMCGVELAAGTCFHVEASDLTLNCTILGPKDGFVTLYSLDNAIIGVASHVTINVTGNIYLWQVRLDDSANIALRGGDTRLSISFGSTLRVSDCHPQEASAIRRFGAIRFSKVVLGHGSKIEITNTQTLRKGAAILTGNLTLEEASELIVVDSTSPKGGGALHIFNVLRLGPRSSVKVTNSSSAEGPGGAISTPRLHMARESKLEVSDSMAHSGGALHISDTLHAEHGASIKICNSAAVDTGGAIHVGKNLRLQHNARIEINNSSIITAEETGELHALHGDLNGGGIFASNIALSNSSIVVANAAGVYSGAIYAEALLLDNASTLTVVNTSATQSAGAISAEHLVLHNASVIKLHGIVADTTATFGEAILVSHNLSISASSSLEISESTAGIRAESQSSLTMRGLRFQRLKHFGVHALEALSLKVVESSFFAIGRAAIFCHECKSINVTTSNFSNVSTFLVSDGRFEHMTLDSLNIRCSSTERPCVQVNTPDIPAYTPTVQLKSSQIGLLALEGQQQQFLSFRLPAATELLPENVQTSCPAGSFHQFQEHNEPLVITKTCAMPDSEFGLAYRLGDGDEVQYCGEEHKLLDCDCNAMGIVCVCTASLNSRWSSAACISCPFGRYAMHPNQHEIHFPLSDLNSSFAWCEDCTSAFKSVGTEVACSASEVYLPPGVMATTNSSDRRLRLNFWRCPNPDACNEATLFNVNALPAASSNVAQASQGMCQKGYDASTPGCTACEWEDYGRSTTDPFVCQPCGNWVSSIASFVLGPIGVLLVGLHAAQQATRKRMSMIVKVMLAYGNVVQTVHNIARQTKVYRSAMTEVQKRWLEGFASQSDGSAILVSFSLDCLFGDGAMLPIEHGILVESMLALVPLALFLALEFCSGQPYFQASWLQRTIVLGNTFLPKILGQFLRRIPCYSLQQESSDRASYGGFTDTYDFERGLQLAGIGILICLVTGPVYWLVLLRRSMDWPEEEYRECLGYLVAGYKGTRQWWEVVVVLRRALFVSSVTLFPASYAPNYLTTSAVTVILASTLLHVRLQPYDDEMMNSLEMATLTSSIIALVLANFLVSGRWNQRADAEMIVFVTLYAGMTLMFVVLVGFFILSFAGVLRSRLKATDSDQTVRAE